MSGNNLSDEALWGSIRSDNVAAFELLVERYWQAVYTTAYSYLEDRDIAMEIANDTFMSIWQKKGHLNISSFKAYLTTSARYHVYKVLRERKTLRLAYVADYESLSYLNAQNNEGEEKIRYMNLKSEIEEALQALPARCREIFLLSRLGELTNTEIAQKLSISKRTVENQISIAHRYLQQNSKDIALGLLLAFMIQ